MIDLGKNRLTPSNIDLINGSDDDSVMSNVTSMTNLTDPTSYSKDELVEMLQNALISRRSSVKGSAPKGNGKPHHKSSDNGEVCPKTTTPICLQLQVKKRSLRVMWRLADSRYQLPPRKETGCKGG